MNCEAAPLFSSVGLHEVVFHTWNEECVSSGVTATVRVLPAAGAATDSCLMWRTCSGVSRLLLLSVAEGFMFNPDPGADGPVHQKQTNSTTLFWKDSADQR